MTETTLPLDTILEGDCVEILNGLPEASVDLIFADPPYNLQLQNELHRPDASKVDAVTDSWDQFASFAAYDAFTHNWLTACKRVLKPTGTLWVIGSYHNIFRVGTIMQNLGYWILNDVLWIKTNPMPNFRGVRFANAHETLIWASTAKGARYTFNHQAMKRLNDGKQMRSDWWILPLTTGAERLRDENGKKAHSTQKPEALLYRIIVSASNPGDVVLDPFFGSGTTGAVAKKLHRHWIGIEREAAYIRLARQRIDDITPAAFDPAVFDLRSRKKRARRVPFSALVENGYLQPGQTLYFRSDRSIPAIIKPDAYLHLDDGFEGSIHQTARHLSGDAPANGWDLWFFEKNGKLISLDTLRTQFRNQNPDDLTTE